jgi:hypothetical protein
MSFSDRIAESRIREAIERGDLDDLPGQGRPIELDDDSQVPEEMRMAHRILRNSGHLPAELGLIREAETMRRLLRAMDDVDDRKRAREKLEVIRLRLAECGQRRLRPLWLDDPVYRRRLLARLESG